MAVVRLAHVLAASGDFKLPVVARIAPDLRVDALGEYFGGIPNISESNIERRKAKPHQVRRPEIADHAAFDHRLNHRIAIVEGNPYLAAALQRLPRRHDIEARQERIDTRHEKFGERVEMIGCVPQRNRLMPASGRKSRSKAKGAA